MRVGIRRTIVTAAMAVIGVMIAACAAAPGGAADADELRAAFSPCAPYETTEVDQVGMVASTWEWVGVDAVEAADRDAAGSQSASIRTTSGETRTLTLFAEMWPGIDWALRHDAEVWLSIADPAAWEADLVQFVMIVTARGDLFFPGTCDRITRGTLVRELGPDAEALLVGLPHVARERVPAYLGLEDAQR